MNVELQEQQFKHDQAVQENWAQFLDKRDEEREKKETECRTEEIKVMREMKKISRSMPSRCSKITWTLCACSRRNTACDVVYLRLKYLLIVAMATQPKTEHVCVSIFTVFKNLASHR